MDPQTIGFTLGLLLGLALHDFNISNIFSALRDVSEDALENAVLQFEPHLGRVHRPGAILILWNTIPSLSAQGPLRYGIYKVFERLSYASHRNLAILSTLGLAKSLFDRFYVFRNDLDIPKNERHIIQKLLRRLIDMGATPSEARLLFQRAIKEDETLDTEVLDIIRFGMKSRWLEHFSLESPAALRLREEDMKGLPATGFTFMVGLLVSRRCGFVLCLLPNKVWLWISELPSKTPHNIFSVDLNSRTILALQIDPDGKLKLQTSSNRKSVVFTKSKIGKLRWTHLALIHHPTSTNPSIRELQSLVTYVFLNYPRQGMFIDGILNDTVNWAYPKMESVAQLGTYTIGDASAEATMSWCIASSYLLSSPLGNSIIIIDFTCATQTHV